MAYSPPPSLKSRGAVVSPRHHETDVAADDDAFVDEAMCSSGRVMSSFLFGWIFSFLAALICENIFFVVLILVAAGGLGSLGNVSRPELFRTHALLAAAVFYTAACYSGISVNPFGASLLVGSAVFAVLLEASLQFSPPLSQIHGDKLPMHGGRCYRV